MCLPILILTSFYDRNTIYIYVYVHYELCTIFFLLIILCIIRVLRQILNVHILNVMSLVKCNIRDRVDKRCLWLVSVLIYDGL